MMNFLENELKNLTEKQKKCYKELCDLGITLKPVYEGSGLFICDTEDDENRKWLDYNNIYWGVDEVRLILMNYEMYFEWENPAVATFWELY